MGVVKTKEYSQLQNKSIIFIIKSDVILKFICLLYFLLR